jgi:hypothetical protein
VVLRCGQCGLPWAKLSNGVLVVESRHHGERHVNVIALETLFKMWLEAQQEQEPQALEAIPAQV